MSVYLEALGMPCQPLEDRGAGIGGVSWGHILHHKPSSDSTFSNQDVMRPQSHLSASLFVRSASPVKRWVNCSDY